MMDDTSQNEKRVTSDILLCKSWHIVKWYFMFRGLFYI